MTQCLWHRKPDSSRSQGCGAAALGRDVSQTPPRAALPGEAGVCLLPSASCRGFSLPGPLLCHLLSHCTGDPALHQGRPAILPMYSSYCRC